MPIIGKRDQLSDAPNMITNSITGETGKEEFGSGVYLADDKEVAATAGIAHQGWVKREVGTGGRAGRETFEVLVAMGGPIATDAVDFVDPATTDVATPIGTADDAILPDA